MNTPSPVEELLRALPRVRIAVLGDFCLDAYWTLDDAASERSLETGQLTRSVRSQRLTLGGAGNVVSNLLALGVGRVEVLGVVGDDPFGQEMRRMFDALGVASGGLLTQRADWDTPVYIKPIEEGREAQRIDFGCFNRLQPETAGALIGALRERLDDLDAVIVNQQLRAGVHTADLQGLLGEVMRTRSERLFVIDTRHLAGVYAHGVLKVNDLEATALCGGSHQPGDPISSAECRAAARSLFGRHGRPVCVTRGARGAMVADAEGVGDIPGLHIVATVDPVGAGDSMCAGLAAGLAAGASARQAAAFGNFVAGVTVQKLFQTGIATPDEVRAISRAPDYVYAPELADDPRQARLIGGTEIERIDAPERPPRLTHAIFDHDGTLSTLRQGWEAVMEPMMVRAILGGQAAAADLALYGRVVARVRAFIDMTTGIQTLVQMQGLVGLVREFGIVPESEILDAARYKSLYLDALMGVVRARIGKLQRGELDAADFTIKKAPEFLERLQAAGVRLYLASGTDEADVIAEARVLGYAHRFEGRIYGAVGDVTIEAKRVALERILHDIGAAGGAGGVVAFGDGPVEIRETRKRGGLCVGVASDEVRRYGLNLGKRNRLIRSGAHLVIPDFSQTDEILQALGIG